MSVVTLADVKALFNPNNPYWDIAVQYLIDSGLYSGALISGAASGDIPLVSGGIRTYTNGGLGGTTKPGVALDVIIASLTSAMGGTLDKLSVSASQPDGASQIGFYDSTAYAWLNSGSVHSAILDLANKINAIVITSGGGGGTGTVISVDMTVPDILAVTGNPITEVGTLAVTLANQTSGTIFAGPISGTSTTPTFRSLSASEIPSGIDVTKIGNGDISNTEFEYLNTTSANIQTQFNTLTTNLSTSSSNLQNQITNSSNNLSAYLPISGGTLTGDLVGTIIYATTLSAANLYVPAKPVGTVYSGPISGSDSIPTFRLLSASDIPSGLDATKISSGTISNTEFDYLNGTSAVIQTQINILTTNLSTSSSNLQTQLGNYLPLSGGTLSGQVTSPDLSSTNISATNLTLSTKSSATFYSGPSTGVAATPTFRTIIESDLPDNIAATKIGTGIINNTEFNRLNGVTGNIQTQFDNINGNFVNFLPTSGGTLTGTLNTLSISATSITATGLTLPTQTSGSIFAGPISGANAVPGFRLLSTSDIPSGIDALKIGSGSVSNTEFGYLDGTSAAIQTQLNTLTINLSTSSSNLQNQINVISSASVSGTVTSVAMTVPSILSVAGSPITTAGTLAVTLATQTSGLFFAGPISGSAVAPTFRLISASDIPSGIDASKISTGSISNTEFDYLNGVSAAIQTQLNTYTSNFVNFLPTSGGTLTGTLNTLGVSSTNISASSLNLSLLPSGQVLYTTSSGIVSSSPKLLYTGIGDAELRIGNASINEQVYLVINGYNTKNRGLFLQSSATNRWVIGVDGSFGELGSDSGGPLRIVAYTDLGTQIDQPIIITRAAGGSIAFARPLTSTSTASFTSITASGLTSGRIPTIGTGGLIQSDAGLTYVRSGSIVVTMILGDGSAASNAVLAVRAPSSRRRIIGLQTGTTDRWTIEAEATAESGSNVGSNLSISSYDDAGAAIDTPISIVRAAGGSISFVRPLTSTSTASFTSITASGLTSGRIPTIGTGGLIGSDAGLTFTQTTSVTTSVVVGNGASSAEVNLGLNGLASQYRLLKFLTSGTNRWLIGAAPGTESGSNAGSPFQILARTDAGGVIDTPISIVRASGGAISLVRPLTSTSTASFTSITASGLTSGRVPYVTTAGLITDSTGLTFNGTTSLTVGQGSGAAVLELDGGPSQWKSVDFSTSGVGRWTFACRNIAETGSDAGSPFVIAAKTDAGVIIDYPISITRASAGVIYLNRDVSILTSLYINSVLFCDQNRNINASTVNSDTHFVVNSTANIDRGLTISTSNLQRWTIFGTGTIESGSNTGTPLEITAYDDSGSPIDTPISIIRASGGTITFSRPITFSSSLSVGALTNTGARYYNKVDRSGSASTGASDHVIRYTSTGGHIETLPAATGSERVLILKHVGTGDWTIDANGSDTIEGSPTIVLNTSGVVILMDMASGLWEIIG